MLIMKPNCECCDRDLQADRAGAMVCSFECTFCVECVDQRLGRRCPNCGGTFAERPTRARTLWEKYPPSTERVTKPHEACATFA